MIAPNAKVGKSNWDERSLNCFVRGRICGLSIPDTRVRGVGYGG